MNKNKSVRGFVAGLVFACTLVGTSSTRTHADSVASTITVGSNPQGVAINPAGTYAYVTNAGDDTVSKINLANDTTAATITISAPSVNDVPQDIAINPAGTFAYVTNYYGTVSKINLATDTVVTTITVGANPRGIAINPAGTFAYVANGGIWPAYSGTVSKINLATDAVTTITVGTEATDVAINPAGTFAYVTNASYQMSFGTVSKINLATDAVSTITVGANPRGIAINPAGTFAYVAESVAVSKINLATETVVASIVKPASNSFDVAINPSGTFAYVTNHGKNSVSKINLVTDSIASSVTSEMEPVGIAINSSGTFAYVANGQSSNVSKIALVASNDPQSITFAAVSTQLLGAKTVALSATALSTMSVAFTSATPTVCTVSGSAVTMLTTGDCTVNANQAGGSGWDAAPQVSRTFTILPSPPVGEVGVSIQNGDSYVNTKQVTLNLIWPEYATAARISNDGGFAASKTQTKNLAASIDWELDDSVKGIYTKVVYVRFNGVADTTKTYSDDIILDTTAPTIETSSAVVASSSVDVSLKATDDITGVDKVELKNGSSTVTKDYAANLSVPMKDIGITVSSASVRKLGTSSIEIRVSDKAGNWSAYKTLSVSGAVTTPTVTTPTVTTPTVTTPTVTTKKAATAKSIAAFAKLKVLSTSKVGLKVVSSYSKYCKVSGTTLKGVKAGTCKVTVTVTPKKGKATSKTVTLKVTK